MFFRGLPPPPSPGPLEISFLGVLEVFFAFLGFGRMRRVLHMLNEFWRDFGVHLLHICSLSFRMHFFLKLKNMLFHTVFHSVFGQSYIWK